MKHKIATFAFAALAVPAWPQTYTEPDSSGDYFSGMAARLNARSLETCDPARDVPELSAKREGLLAIPTERAKLDSRTEAVAAAAMTNDGQYAACFDTELKGSTNMAVLYHGRPRIIAINPDTPNLERAIYLSYLNIRETWSAVKENRLTAADLEKPAEIRPDGVPATPAPSRAPHRNLAYQQ